MTSRISDNFHFCWMFALNATFLLAFHPLLAALWRSKVANVEVSLEGTPSDDDIFSPRPTFAWQTFHDVKWMKGECRVWISFIIIPFFSSSGRGRVDLCSYL